MIPHGAFALGSLAIIGVLVEAKPISPDDLLSRTAAEEIEVDGLVLVKGTVRGVTFNMGNVGNSKNPSYQLNNRWVLLETKGRSLQFGLGVSFGKDWAALRENRWELPRIGDSIIIEGTFKPRGDHSSDGGFGNIKVPYLDDITTFQIDHDRRGRRPGEPCVADFECGDLLMCNDKKCAEYTQVSYSPDERRNYTGACQNNDDCPNNQRCTYPRYTIQSREKSCEYGMNEPLVLGKGICLRRAATCKQVCGGHIGDTRDLVGGRWPSGKEVCIAGKVLRVGHADDNDTHIQLEVKDSSPFPRGHFPSLISTVGRCYGNEDCGAVAEISPPYRDAKSGNDPLAAPKPGDKVVVFGTVQFDPHGWWELHPVKAVWSTGKCD